MKITVGLVVTAKVGEIPEKKGAVRSRMTRKELVGFVQAVAGKKKFRIQFGDRQSKEISNGSLELISAGGGVGKGREDSISDLPPKGEGELLIINGYPVFEEGAIYGNGMYLSLFYCLCFVKERNMDMLEEQLRAERYTDLEINGDIRLCVNRGNH